MLWSFKPSYKSMIWFLFRYLWSIQDITIFPKYVCIKALLRYLSIMDVSKMYWYMILIIFISRYIVYLKNVLIWRNLCVWKSKSMCDFKGESPIIPFLITNCLAQHFAFNDIFCKFDDEDFIKHNMLFS